MYLQQIFNKLNRPLKIFVNEIDLWDDFKEYNISKICEFYIYITSNFSLYRFRNYTNIHLLYELPQNQVFDGILINSDYIYNQILIQSNTFNFVITNNYLNNLDKNNIIESFQYQFIIYKTQNEIKNSIKIIPEQKSNIDHTIYLQQKIFPENYKPKVFIVTPIYNQSEWTIKCIDSINKYAEQKYDITHILVDNGSNQQNKNNINEFIKNIHNIKIHFINFDQPIGFVKATNAGIKYALQQNADYIGLQNNDTEVSQNWMSKLINGIHGQVVAASPIIIQNEYLQFYNQYLNNFPIKTINITPTQASNILNKTYQNTILNTTKAQNNASLGLLCFCCAIFNANIFKYYLLDNCFGIGYADDTDYCYQLLNHGLGLAHVLNCAIKHYSQKTFSTIFNKTDIQNIQNARLYQANIINNLNIYNKKTTVIYTINLQILNNFKDYQYYDLNNCDYVYITIPENINKISNYWKVIDITKLNEIFKKQCKTKQDIITYFQLHPELLFRNYIKSIYIDSNYQLNIYPYLLDNFIENKNIISILNNTILIINNNILSNLQKFNNIWELYKLNPINLIDHFQQIFKKINYLNSKILLNENIISLQNIVIYVYCSNFYNYTVITYYREKQPYTYLQQLGYTVKFINNFQNIDYLKINYLVLPRDFSTIFYKNPALKKLLNDKRITYKFKIIYNIDDLLYDIPKNNLAHDIFLKTTNNNQLILQQYFKDIFQFADIIIPTTEYFKKSIINKFNINPEKIYPINNLISNDIIHHNKIIPHNFSVPIKIGIIANNTHITNSGTKDDFSILYDWFKENINKYEFHFFGSIPNELKNKPNCFFYPTWLFQQYENVILPKQLDLFIACLADNEFNKCKSNLKLIESYALKIPIITNNIEPYKENKYKFNSSQQINNIIKEICSSQENYHEIINKNYQYLLQNYTIENRINQYIKILLENLNIK